jgi:protein-S-isoprenylcysteine O-methyltransferase Ste14
MEKKPTPIYIVAPVYMGFALIAMLGLHLYAPVREIIPTPYSYLGVLAIIAGAVTTSSAARSFFSVGTPIMPFRPTTALVTHGIYRVTRNPMYLGLTTILIGAAMLFGTLSPWLLVPTYMLVIEARFIRGEERFLEEIFGQQYLSYKNQVRRWL